MVGICATPPAVWVLSSPDIIHPGCFDRGLACKVAAEVVKAGTGASASKPAFPWTKTSAVTEFPWNSYILFRSLSLDKVMRVRVFPGRKYFMITDLYSKFNISANFNLRSSNRVS
ncbi:unnamed protein product [Malus baccata var. baccata]